MTSETIEKFVFVEKNRMLTTSLLLAEGMGVSHEDVLKAFDKATQIDPEEMDGRSFLKRNFIIVEAADKSIEMIKMTRAGFAFLGMDFNTPQARKFKYKIVSKFEEIQHSNKGRLTSHQPDVESDIIEIFIKYARSQGSTDCDEYSIVFTKTGYRSLRLLEIGLPAKDWESFSNKFRAMESVFLISVDSVCLISIKDGMQMGLHYKEIFKHAKIKAEACVATLPSGLKTVSLSNF